MRTLSIYIIWLILACDSSAIAASKSISLSYDVDPAEITSDTTASWSTFDIDDAGPEPVAEHRIAVSVLADGIEIMRLWDRPTERNLPAIGFDMAHPRAKITLRAVAYQGAPWHPSHAYSLDDKLSTGEMFPNSVGMWVCSRAGTSGTTAPDWPMGQQFAGIKVPFFDSGVSILYGAVIDNGNGTVTITYSGGHQFASGDQVTIIGTTNYDGDYTLGDQTGGSSSQVILTHAYVSETVATPDTIYLTAGAVTNTGSGTVLLSIPAHGFSAGQVITITGTTNYNGDHTLPTQTNGDVDHLEITATYVVEAPPSTARAYPAAGSVTDLGGGLVSLALTAHGYSEGQTISISGTTNYSGEYTLPTQTNGDADHLVITATYILEAFDYANVRRTIIDDPDGSGAQWIYTPAVVNYSYGGQTGRLIVQDTDGNGVVNRAGINFIRRYAP